MKDLPQRKRLVVANWKMNPTTTTDAVRIAKAVAKKLPKPTCDVAIAPSFIHTDAVKSALPKKYILAAQDGDEKDLGPITGAVSLRMLYSAGVRLVLLGHSERRARGETDEYVQRKVRTAITLGITPVVCVGESARDVHGKYFEVVESQVRAALAAVKRTEAERVVIAYEPVWAISSGDGKGATATPEDAHEMKLFIHKILVELFGRAVAAKVRILYGGSVNQTNARELMQKGEIDGFLVGGASLRADEFASIVTAVEK